MAFLCVVILDADQEIFLTKNKMLDSLRLHPNKKNKKIFTILAGMNMWKKIFLSLILFIIGMPADKIRVKATIPIAV